MTKADALNILIGIVTLGGSLYIARTMYDKGRQQLTVPQAERLYHILLRFRYYQLIPGLLFALYVAGKIFTPEQNLLNVLFLWTSYNIFLWLKMRWIMKQFRQHKLPADFQTNYVFSQIIGYTGLVSSMLILFRGENL